MCNAPKNNFFIRLKMGKVVVESGAYCVAHLNGQELATSVQLPRARAPSKEDRDLSRKQEQEIMERAGGRRQPGSGSFRDKKGDGRIYNHLRMEAKWTKSKRFILKHQELSKIRAECSDMEYPMFVVDFKESSGRTYDRFAVLPFSIWERMHNATFDDSRPR